MKETRNFRISLKIEYNDGSLVDLSGKWDIEIDWDKLGEGWVCGSEIKDGKEIKKGSLITFEKNGKNYQILVKIGRIKKGWFKDKVIDYDFEVFTSDKNWIVCKTTFGRRTWWGWNSEWSYKKIEPTQKRWIGFVLIGLLSFIAVFVLILYVKKIKKRSQ